jgi:hypothetical protein
LANGLGDRQLYINTLGDNLARARQEIDSLKRELQTKTMLQVFPFLSFSFLFFSFLFFPLRGIRH